MLRRFGRAMALRCPNCGSGGVVRRLRLADRCPSCRHRFERHEGYWLGAIAINTVVTIGLFGIGLVTALAATWPDPPWGAVSAAAVAFNAIFPVVFYPWSKTLWVALDLTAHPPQ